MKKKDLFPNFASTEQAAEYVQDTFRSTLRESSAPAPKPFPMDYHDLYPRFDLRVATRYAHNSNTPEMVQAIFYAMVVDDVAELGHSCRLIMDCMMWAMRKLDWNPVESWLGDIDRRLRRQASRLAPTSGPRAAQRTCGKKDDLFSDLPGHYTCSGILGITYTGH